MTPETAELLKQTDASIREHAKKAGTPDDGSVVVRLRPDVHDAVYERIAIELMDGPEGYAVVFAGFPITRGPENMKEAWRFFRHEDLPRRKASKIERED